KLTGSGYANPCAHCGEMFSGGQELFLGRPVEPLRQRTLEPVEQFIDLGLGDDERRAERATVAQGWPRANPPRPARPTDLCAHLFCGLEALLFRLVRRELNRTD